MKLERRLIKWSFENITDRQRYSMANKRGLADGVTTVGIYLPQLVFKYSCKFKVCYAISV